jgi:hypothetical protein
MDAPATGPARPHAAGWWLVMKQAAWADNRDHAPAILAAINTTTEQALTTEKALTSTGPSSS